MNELVGFRDVLVDIVLALPKQFEFNESLYSVELKATQDYVTRLDRQIEQFIGNQLKEKYPEHHIAGEEFGGKVLESGPLWLIDPLDGTANFVSGVPFYAVSVALFIGGQVKVACVYDLVRHELFDAVEGLGARMNAVAVTPRENIDVLSVAVSSGVIDYFLACKPSVLQQIRKMAKLRILGSQALQLCYVAAGKLAANISVEAKVWDDAAGMLIAQEAGLVYLCKDVAWGESLFSLCASRDVIAKLQPLLGPDWGLTNEQ